MATKFARELQAHLENWSGDNCPHPPKYSHWLDGIHPNYRELASKATVADEVKLDDNIAHLRSSQAFALNLFLPFREGGKRVLSECLSNLLERELSVEDVRFEWVPPGDLLGELDGHRPKQDEPATAVDVVIWCRLEDVQRATVLVEVKLSEAEFTNCDSSSRPWNKRRDVCKSAQLFFSDPNACYLRRPYGKQRDRRYWEIFATNSGSVRNAFPGAKLIGPCPFVGNAQQPMRNLAIAKGLEQNGSVEAAWFVLCVHDHNPNALKRWDEWKKILPDPDMAPILLASEVVSAGEEEGLVRWATWMRERYQLGESI